MARPVGVGGGEGGGAAAQMIGKLLFLRCVFRSELK